MCWSLLALLCGKWPTSSMEKLLLRDSNACKIQKVCLSSLKPDTARWSCRDQRGGEQPGEHDIQWKLLGPEAADGCGQQDRGECSGQHRPEGRTDHRCWGGGEMGLCVCVLRYTRYERGDVFLKWKWNIVYYGEAGEGSITPDKSGSNRSLPPTPSQPSPFMLLYTSMHITQLSEFHKCPDVQHHV